MGFVRIETLIKNRATLTKKQRKLCDYILNHADQVSLMPVADLAREAEVGEATVFRFLKETGYSSYTDFKKEIHAYAVSSVSSSYWQLNAALATKKRSRDTSPLFRSIRDMVELLEKSYTPDLAAAFQKATQLIVNANHVLIYGLRSSKPIALYFESMMTPFSTNIVQLSNNEHFALDRIALMQEGDILFLITDWPFTKDAIHAAQFCHERGHPIVLLTNNIVCEVSAYADATLVVKAPDDFFSRLSTLAVLEALANQVAEAQPPEVAKHLQEIDQVLSRFDMSRW